MHPECKRKRQTEEEADKKVVGLYDLSTDVKQHIASYLPLFDVELNLRRTCRDTFWNFQKPPPDNLEYDFVYFTVSKAHGRFHLRHGVAHTTNDVLVAMRNHDWGVGDILISLKFVKFDRNHSTVPLFEGEISTCRGVQPVDLDSLGCHYCVVQVASDVGLDESAFSLDRSEDPDQMDQTGAVFRHCRDWTPREPRMQLRHIGPRKIQSRECSVCGRVFGRDCDCSGRKVQNRWYHIYYSPEWFEDRDALIALVHRRIIAIKVYFSFRNPWIRGDNISADEWL